ncbi:MAG: DUF1573 domain-containing protein [Candidatus Cloacimonadota bacterium]|nr:MAG: DUF1573 domain-containing protein [Candidatus Cloacimonadota bacterium]
MRLHKLLTTVFFFLFFYAALCAEPIIVFEKKVFDFGEILAGETAVCLFHFKNDGDTTLKILDVRATCGCTVTKLSKKLIEPGEKGTINAVFYSTGRRGKVSKSIYITTNDKANKSIRLKIVGIIKKTWKCEPENIDFGEITKKGKLIDTVTISSISVDTIRIDSVTTEPSSRLEAKIVSHKGNNVILEVSLNTSEIKWRFIGIVKFYSNITGGTKIIIPVYARLKEE